MLAITLHSIMVDFNTILNICLSTITTGKLFRNSYEESFEKTKSF